MSVERESHKAPPPLAEFILGPRFARTRGRAPPPRAGEENKALPHIFLSPAKRGRCRAHFVRGGGGEASQSAVVGFRGVLLRGGNRCHDRGPLEGDRPMIALGTRHIARALAICAALFASSAANAAEFTLMPTPKTVNIGNFNAANKPALTINSGDIVTLEAATQLEPEAIDASHVVAPSVVPQYVRDIYRDVKDRGPGPHVLTGPIFVNGAMPGDVLEVRILAVDLATGYGYNRQRPYTGALPDEFTGFWQ